MIELFNPSAHYREAALCWGIGAGKSFLSSIVHAYIAYRLLCLKDPQAYYGLAPDTEIAVVNFSITATQAKRVVFSEVKARIDNAACFQGPGFESDPTIRSELRWPEKKVIIFPGNSQAESAIGYNVIAAVIDEACWLPDVAISLRIAGIGGSVRYDAAEELYNAITDRIISRGNARWQRDAKLVMISSPRYIDDFLQRKLREAADNPAIYHSRLATWEGIPALRLSGETFGDSVAGPVPVEYRERFERDPERARRDLAALPSVAIEAFFGDAAGLEAVFRDKLVNCFDGINVNGAFRVDRRDGPRWVHVDLALKRDACGIAVGQAMQGGLLIDGLTYLEAKDFPSGEIELAHVRELIMQLSAMGVVFGRVTYDGFQSADSIQQLNTIGIPAGLHSVDRNTESYDTLKDLVQTRRIIMPSAGRAGRFLQEARRLELIKGKKVDHPPGGSKDVADAVAGVAYHFAATPVIVTKTISLVDIGADGWPI